MDVAISGSSGLIGTALVTALTDAGHRPVRLVRREPSGDEIRWDPDGGSIESASLEGIDAVVHLAGAGIGFYGDRGDELLDEASPVGTGFLPEVCVAWEAATVAAEEGGIRVAH